MRTDPFINGRKYRKLVNNAIFIRMESLFVVSAPATTAFQLKHMLRLLSSICPVGYRIWTIEYGKILVVLLYGKYYWRVYEVYSYWSRPLAVPKPYSLHQLVMQWQEEREKIKLRQQLNVKLSQPRKQRQGEREPQRPRQTKQYMHTAK